MVIVRHSELVELSLCRTITLLNITQCHPERSEGSYATKKDASASLSMTSKHFHCEDTSLPARGIKMCRRGSPKT